MHILRDRTRLKAVHRRRVERDGAADTAPAFDPLSLSAEVRKRAIFGFSQLFATEYESVVIAAWMTAGLARIGAPLDLVGAFGKVSEDEIRHTDIMAQVLEGFSETPNIQPQPLPPKAETIAGADAIEEVLSGLACFFCVGEELSAHIFKASAELATEPRMRWATSEIFTDEATHGAFGFEAARELVKLLDDTRKLRVAARIAEAVVAFERRLGGPLTTEKAVTADERALAGLGLLPPQALLSIFYTEVEKSLLPRLEDIGLPISVTIG